jgi:hypothetical protein
MAPVRTVLLTACILAAPTIALCQQEPMPEKIDPATVKLLQDQEKRLKDEAEESKKHSEPKFGSLQCRADAQKWTIDPFDNKDGRNLAVNTAIMVNGQFRTISHITPHVTVIGLQERTHEMEVCTEEDSDFEKQFSTYSTIAETYEEERTFRYMYFLSRHNLDKQFIKEDAEDNK